MSLASPITQLIRRILIVCGTAALVFATGADARDIQLPDMGSPADAILNKSEESSIGRMIMRDIRASVV